MRFLYLWLFGFCVATYSAECEGALANLFLRLGIGARLSGGKVHLSLADIKKIRMSSSLCGLQLSPAFGVLPFFVTLSRRYFTVAALLFAVFINVFLSGVVFDIRISGNDTVPDYVIRAALEESGVTVGKRFSMLDTEELEVTLLDNLNSVAWVNLNRRGTVLYVEVVERKGAPDAVISDAAPVNIVAACDCVIAEITVKSGRAEVKVGDVVKKGDILISGVVENDTGTALVHAEGRVLGTVTGQTTGFAQKEELVKITEELKSCEFRLNILNFSANIFKNYRNCSDGCAIIVDNEYLCLHNGTRLPIGYTRKLCAIQKECVLERTEGEMIFLAYERHNAALSALLSGGEPLKIKTVGTMGDGVYTVSSIVTYLTDVGEEKGIELSPAK